MKLLKVTNLTQGRLEIPEEKKVLDAGAWAVIKDELPPSLKRRLGGRFPTIRVEEIVQPAKVAPAPSAKPSNDAPPKRGASPAKPE